jgi:general secretion pathway protein F
MASYRWRALTGEGRVIEGVEQAGSRAALLSALEARDLLPIDIDAASAMSEPSEPVDRAALSRTELHHATQELAMLLKQGVALDRALGVLAAGSKPAVRVLFEGLRNDILCGRSFAQALGRHPGQFSRAYVAMVASAERAGTLDRSLELLSDDLAREIALRRKLTAAIAYPAFLLAAALMVLVFILVAVVPGFRLAAASAAGPAGPGDISFIFALSDFVLLHWPMLSVGLLLVAAIAAAVLTRPKAVDRLLDALDRAPVLADLMLTARTATIGTMLSMLLASGVDLTASLRQVAERLGERRAGKAMAEVSAAVRAGQRLTEALDRHRLVTASAIQMLRVGEEAGEIGAAALRVAAIHQVKLERRLDRIAAILAPSLLLAVSALIAWIIISVVLAMLDLSGAAL